MITAKQADHLGRDQRASIRYSLATLTALARKYGVSVATISLIRSTAVRDHPARIAAGFRIFGVKVTTIPATAVRRPKANTFIPPPR